jgi:hypothetical protein
LENPFAETVNALQIVHLFFDRPNQVDAYFQSRERALQIVANSALFLKQGVVESSQLRVQLDNWKQRSKDAISSYQDIAVGVASANVASGVLSFVPVVGRCRWCHCCLVYQQ